MQFDEASDYIIEEDIEGLSYAQTPQAAANVAVNSFSASQVQTVSHNPFESAPASKQLNWQDTYEDRSELLSQSRGVTRQEIMEEDFADRTDLQSESQIPEDIFSRGETSA